MGQLIQGVNDLQTKYPRLLDPHLPNTNSAIRIDCTDDGRKGKLDEPIKLLLCRLDPHNEISVDA